ncbi:MAG: hypothetical protein WCK98_06150 [bacterium]
MEKSKTDLTLFENYKIRRIFDEKTKTWYFSVEGLKNQGSEVVTRCHLLKCLKNIRLKTIKILGGSINLSANHNEIYN